MTTATRTARVRTQTPVAVPESIINDAPKMLEAFSVGDVTHQGDLTIVCIATLPKSAKPRKSQQIADGETQGSRHILRDGIAVYGCDPKEVAAAIKAANGCGIGLPYIGPVFVSPANPTEHDLSHPEHGHQGFSAGAVCAVVIQRSLDAEEREQRVQD